MSHLPTRPYRGTRDFLPEEMSVRTQMFEKLFRAVELFGFRRYDGPILEPAAIYEAKSGGEIANEQMYRLVDKKGRELALRPEMTPSVARIIAGHQNEIVFPSRWYSHVNCHRYERPQRGRVREHWQLNVDLFGSEDIGAEIEMFDLIGALMSALGASDDMYVVRVNDRVLVDAAISHHVGVPTDRVSAVGKVIDRWEKVSEDVRREGLTQVGLSSEQIARLEALLQMDLQAFSEAAGSEAAERSLVARIVRDGLSQAPVQFDPLIFRGFDYYTSTVFEVFDTAPENRRSLFGGGRYDNLASLFTDRRIPGIGFGMGDVTAWNFLESHGLLPKADLGPDVFVFGTSPEFGQASRSVARSLRAAGLRAAGALDAPSMKSGLKMADKLGARYAAVIGDREHSAGTVLVKDLSTAKQATVPVADVVDTVTSGALGAET